MFNLISTKDEFEQLLENSIQEPQLLLKLSPICPTSFQIQREMDVFLKTAQAPKACSLDVIKSRALSREIADIVGVRHESPQAILFVDKKVVWNASHYSVNGDSILKALK